MYSRTDATRFLTGLAVMLRRLCAHAPPISRPVSCPPPSMYPLAMRLLGSAIMVVALSAGASTAWAQAPAQSESPPAESVETGTTNLGVVALIVVLAIAGVGWF